MISKLIIASLIAFVATQQLPEQYPAGVDPAKCPNFPICDNALLHNSQAVPRSIPSQQAPWNQPQHHQQQQHNHHQQQQQQQHRQEPPRHQWVATQQQEYQQPRQSVPVSHRNTVPSYNPAPVPSPTPSYNPAPAYHAAPSYNSAPVHAAQPSSQWTLKNLRFDSDDSYQAPASNDLVEQHGYVQSAHQSTHHQQQQQQYQQPQPQAQNHHQHFFKQEQQQEQPQQQYYKPEPQYQEPQYQEPQQYQQHAERREHSTVAEQYPAGVDARSCPNYPFCETGGPQAHPVNAAPVAAAPLPGFTERLYPAGVSAQQCANFPYCFE